MNRGQPLGQRVRGSEHLRLLFVKMPAPADVELAGHTGFDGVIVDTEHGPAAAAELEHHLRAADAAGVPALVRVPSVAPGPILAALDAGACGIVVPHVVDADVARAAVAAAHYPPRGRRGLALTNRAGHYGTASITEHLAGAAQETIVVVQIEDAEAIERADQILSVDGVDAVLIGVTDLSVSLEHPGAPEHPDVRGAIDVVCAAAKRADVAIANVVADDAQARAWHDRGAAIAVFVATLLTRDAFRAATGATSCAGAWGGGDGPLVMVPGMLGTADEWDDVAAALAATTSLRFARIDVDRSVEEMAESVLAVSPERFALAGHSLGAIVALAVRQRAPGRVSRLALLNASARPASGEQLARWNDLERRTEAGELGELAAELARGSVATARRGDGALTARIAAMALSVGAEGFLRQLAAQRARPDLRPFLREIGCPTLVISGAQDELCPPLLQDELADTIQGARLERLDGCGHMSTLEAPERVAALLTALLRNDPPEALR